MEAVTEPTMLMEIERELAGPDAARHLDRYDAVLVRLGLRIDAAMKEGLPPEEFPNVQALRDANVTARKILRLSARVGGQVRKA